MTLPHELPKVVSELQSQRQQSVHKLRSIALDFIQGITEDALSSFHFLPLRHHLPPPSSEPPPPNPAPAPAQVTRSRNSKRKAPAAGLDDQHTRPTRRTRQAAQSKVLEKAVVPDKENVNLSRPLKGTRTRTRRAARPPLKPVAVNTGTKPPEIPVDHGSKHPTDDQTAVDDKTLEGTSLEAGPVVQSEGCRQNKQETQQERKEGDGRGGQEEVCSVSNKERKNLDQEQVTAKARKKKRKGRGKGKGRKRDRNGDEIVKGEDSEPSRPAVLETSGLDKQPDANENPPCIEGGRRAAEQEEHSCGELRSSPNHREPRSSLRDPHHTDSNRDSSHGESPAGKRRVRRRVKGRVTRAPRAEGYVDENPADLDQLSDHEKLPSPTKMQEGITEMDKDKGNGEGKAGSVDDMAEATKPLKDERRQDESDYYCEKNASADSPTAQLTSASANPSDTKHLVVAEGCADDSHEDDSRRVVEHNDVQDERNLVPRPSSEDGENEDQRKAPNVECSVSPKLQTRGVSHRTEPDILPTGTLFTVGEDGMIGQATIGALSQLASTPATSYRGQAEEEAEAEAGTHRRTRLFNPKTSIYPSSRKPPLLSSSRGLSSTAHFLQAPQPKDADTNASADSSSQPLARGRKYISFKESNSSDSQGQLLVVENPDIARSAVAANARSNGYSVPFMEVREGKSREPVSPGKRETLEETSTDSAQLDVRSSVTFNAGRNEAGSPLRDSMRIKTLFKEAPYPSIRMNNPKTAPGQRAFPRPTDKKLTKSAYRQRIERLHANAHALSSIGRGSQKLSESDPKRSESNGSSDEAIAVDENEPSSDAVDAEKVSACVDTPGSDDRKDSSLRKSGTTQMLMPGEQKNAKNNTAEEALGSRHPAIKRSTSGNASSTCTAEKCEDDMTSRVEEVLQKSRKLSLERVTPNSTQNDVSPGRRGNQNEENKLEAVQKLSPASTSNDAIAEETPGKDQPSTSHQELNSSDMDTNRVSPSIEKHGASSEKSDVANLSPARQSSQTLPVPSAAVSYAPDTGGSSEPSDTAQEPTHALSTNTFSNLVSSVASFLPVSSSLFGAHADPKEGDRSIEDQAKLTAKRQKEDAERREAELIAKREAVRLTRQKEGQERQKKAENRRKLLAEMERHREEERRKKEALRLKKRREEEEKQRLKKEEEDRRKEEHRRRVLEQKHKRMMAAKQGARDGQHQTKLRRPGQANPRQGQLHGQKYKTLVSDALPPKTPVSTRPARVEEDPQWELTGERKRGISENSEEERDRRRRKKIPQWAASSQVWMSLTNENSDPDTVFARGAPSCNLETVFQGTEGKRKFRPRDDSGDWTKDRLTAKEEMEYKRNAGFFDNA